MTPPCPHCGEINKLYLDEGDIDCLACGWRREYAPPKDAAALRELDPRYTRPLERRKAVTL